MFLVQSYDNVIGEKRKEMHKMELEANEHKTRLIRKNYEIYFSSNFQKYY
jgi:hypothetical protein